MDIRARYAEGINRNRRNSCVHHLRFRFASVVCKRAGEAVTEIRLTGQTMSDVWRQHQLRDIVNLIAQGCGITNAEAKILTREIDRLRLEAEVARLNAERKANLPWWKKLAEILPMFWLGLELTKWWLAIPFRPN